MTDFDLNALRPTRRSALKGLALGTVACLIGETGLTAPMALRARKLPRVRPESVGIAPAGVLAFVEEVNRKLDGLHSFMLLRNGQVAAEGWWAPYGPQHPHMLYSLSKSFTSTGIGLCVSEERLTVDAPVSSFFPDEMPAKVSDNLAAMRVRHLLTMSTGHDKDATGPATAAPDGNWARSFLALPVEHKPGTHFVYNSAATYMLSAIVQKLTGGTLLDYLKPRLFEPLGITGPTWETCPRGINTGGWGLNVKTEDIARFGQTYLQNGKWEDKQVIPEAWVQEATSRQISNGTGGDSDWTQGYGYQFWRCRHGAFRGDGAFGQYCVVIPERDAVLAITSGLGDMQAVLNAVWDHLLPAIHTEPIEMSTEYEALKQKLGRLSVPPPAGKTTSPTATRVSGKTFRLEPNDEKMESVTLTFDGDRSRLTLHDARGDHPITAGSRDWVRGATPGWVPGVSRSRDPLSGKMASQGAWTDDDTYTMKLCYYETPYIQTVTCKFSGDQVTMTRKMNVTFGPMQSPTLVGRMG